MFEPNNTCVTKNAKPANFEHIAVKSMKKTGKTGKYSTAE